MPIQNPDEQWSWKGSKSQVIHWIGTTPFALRRPAAGQRYEISKVQSPCLSLATSANDGLSASD